jgi:hypothetical protein
MTRRDGKDAFYQPPAPMAEEGEPLPPERTTREWTRRLFVDGVEVDPATMQPIPQEE